MGTNSRLKQKLRVAIVSERRADYSRFKPILSLMENDPFFDYKLIVTGISLLKNYGEDIKIIKRDGFKIASVIPMFRENAPDSGAEMTRAYSRVMSGLSDVFEALKPDLVLTGFDIGANFSAAVVGAHMNIPVAHIQGGEITGSIDESLRHATSKFANIHFAATKEAANRIRRMGEDPRFIFVVGCPSIDVLVQSPVISRKNIMGMLKLNSEQPYVVIVQHSVTSEIDQAGWQITQTLEAVKEIGIQGVIFYPNNDAGTSAIISGIRNSHISYIKSLSSEIFINVLRYSEALIGNSSTGIHETATLHVPTVNIGTRQQGRERPKNVIDSSYQKEEIKNAIRKALYDKKFKEIVQNVKNPYGDGHSAERIIKILKTIDIKNIPIQKRFID
ncbi:MAG: UDP-N-acetylglucosamine 2-epimerase [Candidatus Nealsonbacteria bacterium]|nr:UDP-N-acetylglucosamine 2-epimerase [Candidatus Nealsonbacteria bacterium]